MPLLLGANFAVSLILLGVALAGSLLLKPKSKAAISDKEATTTSSRGSVIPSILGHRRTGPAILWVGEREVRKESSGKGKGGLFGPPKQNVFYEAAWHGLCVGPGAALNRIWSDGKLIWTGPITSGSHPSGTIINVPGEGDFEIHWGEEVPSGADAYLSDAFRVGISSGWPLLMYVTWRPKKLGLAPRWPNIEYEVEVIPYGTSLAGGAPFIVSSGGPLGDDSGANPAHVLEQYLMQPYPHGMGYSSALFDLPSLQALSTLCIAEQLTISPVLRDGDDFAAGVLSIMSDVGLFLPLVDGKVYFKPIRPEDNNYPVLYEDVILLPRPETDAQIGDPESNAIQFGFTDRARAYRPNAIGDANDAPDIYRDSRNIRKVTLETLTALGVAARVSTRRAQEELSRDTKIRVLTNHTTRDIYPGMVIQVADIPYRLRVLSVKPAQLTQQVEIDCVPDYFGALTTWTPDLGGNSGGGVIPILDNQLVLDAPPWQGGPPTGNVPGEPHPAAIAIIQARSTTQVLGAEIWLSVDDVTYQRVGLNDTTGIAGELDEDLPIDGKLFLDSGPLVTFDGIDLNLLQDLSTNLLAWSVGHQAVYVGGEILFVQWFEAVSGNQFRMRGVYRARKGYGRKAHVATDRIMVFSPDDIFIVSDGIIAASPTVYIKAQPYTWTGPKDLSTVTPVVKNIADLSIQIPFGIENLRVPRIRGHRNWIPDSGSPVVFSWEYRSSVGQRSGAGLQLPGEATASTPPLGTFELEILLADHTTVVHTVVGLTTPTYSITWANLEAATGALTLGDDIWVRVRENALGRFSAWKELQVVVV